MKSEVLSNIPILALPEWRETFVIHLQRRDPVEAKGQWRSTTNTHRPATRDRARADGNRGPFLPGAP